MEDFPGVLAQPLDRSVEVPVGAQLAWRLRMLIAGGTLSPGDRLPSARELARAVGVNVNTVFAVYGRLEGEGLIETQHGRGSFVLAPPPNAAGIAGLVQQTASAARAAGLDPRDIAMSLFANPVVFHEQARETLATSSAEALAPAAGDAASERRRLREEINLLELELIRLQWPSPREEPAISAHAQAEPRVLDAAALRTVRDQLQARVDALAVVTDKRQAEAQARRRSRATTTLDRPSVALPNPEQSRSYRPQPRSPIIVRWTPHWGIT
jgi:DNA-binding transcriptional regulator YhcF (GntR family)